ncbi:TPA: glycosyltransferase [Vibrio parahaemolyticus]|nr:glycosyltransferase [Vibrio parahaemolyticus]
MEKDISVIVIGTQWNNQELAKTLDSVMSLKLHSDYDVECLLIEGLAKNVDVNKLNFEGIERLPSVVTDYLQYDDFNYYVDHFSVSDFLKRVFRVAQGKYFILLREGDEIGLSKTLEPIEFNSPIYLLPQINNPDLFALFNRTVDMQNNDELIAKEVLALNFLSYDGAFAINKELAVKYINKIPQSDNECFFSTINHLVWLLSLTQSTQIKLSRSIATSPVTNNFEQHWSAIQTFAVENLDHLVHEQSIESESKAIALNYIWQISEIVKKAIKKYFESDNEPAERELYFSLRGLIDEINAIQVDFPCNDLSDLSKKVKVSLVSSLFRGQEYVYSFLLNLLDLKQGEEQELLIVSPGLNLLQDLVLASASNKFNKIKVFALSEDPGIYNCWNYAIKQAQGEYISNANLDDRRHKNHVAELTKLLDETAAKVAGAGIAVTEDAKQLYPTDYTVTDLISHFSGEVWYFESGDTRFTYKNLNDFFVIENSELKQCMNYAHCMPMWRKDIHEQFGYFDEEQFGTYADFALWLQLLAAGEKYVHLNKNLGLYLIDPNSHNRRNNNSEQWLSMVKPHLPEGVKHGVPEHVGKGEFELSIGQYNGKLNFGTQFEKNYGNHRSGWSYAIAGLVEHHDATAPVYVDTFIERKFVWGGDHGEACSNEPMPYEKPWIGFIHVPPFVPSWFQFEQSNQQIFSTDLWKKSLPHCKGLICLTKYHKQALEEYLKPEFPISVLKHPTEFPENSFSIDKYRANATKRIVQIGWWLRKLNAIGYIEVKDHTPTLLGSSDWSKNIIQYAERRYFGLKDPITIKNVDIIDFLDNDKYDELLTENIVFIDFYDTSANNAVIECIARATPIVVCRHPAVEEYLGEDYPLFYDSPNEISSLVTDNLVAAAHEHMKNNTIREKLTLESFVKDFGECEVVKNAVS